MALDVIGAGFGRTGTLSLKTALEMLGFGPCHHMTEVLENPAQLPFWNRAADGEAVDWDEVYGDYRATVDWPGCAFYAELAEHYPQAKVILSRRDPEAWFASMEQTILASMSQMGLAGETVPDDHPMRFGAVLIADRAFGGDFSKANVIAAYERHNAAVIDAIPQDRLLVFEAAQGWAPLCEFLDVPVPDSDYPRSNDAGEFAGHAERAKQVAAEESARQG